MIIFSDEIQNNQLNLRIYNPAVYKKRLGALKNSRPNRGPAEAGIFCIYKKEISAKISCSQNGTVSLVGTLPTCDEGCDPRDLGGFQIMTPECRKGLK